ncbi:putative odorant-binding protein A10 [Drosophila madeirensis]|uniref:Odorant-binding protein A10 n=1 Tax=Drosophila madeirensis TaxID=30013 RepID=A0AAU9FZS5_DROMD
MSHTGISLTVFRTVVVVTLMFVGCTQINGLPHPPQATSAPLLVDGVYDEKFDNVDLDEILAQERLLNNYIKCLESTGPCTPDAKMLREILPDAILTDCTKCTEKQKFGAEKVTRHLIDNRPNDWERLEKIYDPEGTYRIKYQNSKGIAMEQIQSDS